MALFRNELVSYHRETSPTRSRAQTFFRSERVYILLSVEAVCAPPPLPPFGRSVFTLYYSQNWALPSKPEQAIGSVPLERQVRELGSDLHVFGHTHIPIDMVREGVRYLQWPLGKSTEVTLTEA